jgi:hypothetical protein
MDPPRLSQNQWQILRVLASQTELAVSEITRAVGAREDSISRSLEPLKMLKLVAFRKNPGTTRVGRGAPQGWWKITARGQKLLATNPLPPTDTRPVRTGSATIRSHQSFVSATVSARGAPDLLEALATGTRGADASFVVRLDGDGHEYIFFFEPQLGIGPSERLTRAVGHLADRLATGVVGEVRTPGELQEDGRS